MAAAAGAVASAGMMRRSGLMMMRPTISTASCSRVAPAVGRGQSLRTFAKTSKAPPPEPKAPPPALAKKAKAPEPVVEVVADDEVIMGGEGEDEEYDGEDGEYDEEDRLDGLSAAQKRRVFALDDVQKKYDELQVEYVKELAHLQAKYCDVYAPIFDERKAIVSGEQAVGDFEVQSDDSPDEGLPEFWLTAMTTNDKVAQTISQRDEEVLKYLTDVRYTVFTGAEHGFKLVFHFKENPFFSNSTLEKTYLLEQHEDLVPTKFIGCDIDWKEGKDTTVELVKKRVKGAKAKGGKAFETETVPCESFFKLFNPPAIPDDSNSMEDNPELEDAISVDFDVGYSFKEQVIPRAVEWYTGEIAPMDGNEGDDEYYEGEEGDFEDADMPAPGPPGRRR